MDTVWWIWIVGDTCRFLIIFDQLWSLLILDIFHESGTMVVGQISATVGDTSGFWCEWCARLQQLISTLSIPGFCTAKVPTKYCIGAHMVGSRSWGFAIMAHRRWWWFFDLVAELDMYTTIRKTTSINDGNHEYSNCQCTIYITVVF